MPDKDKLSTPETLQFPVGSYTLDPVTWKIVAPFVAPQPTPKSDIIHSLEDNMSVKAAPDPAGIMTPEQVKEFGQTPYYRDYGRVQSFFEQRDLKLRDVEVCDHTRKRFVVRWRCVDCGVYL